MGNLAATPQVTVLAYISAGERLVRAFRGGRSEVRRLDTTPPTDRGFVERTLSAGRAREEGFWNEIYYGERTQRSFINYARPIRRDGAFLGVVVALVSLKELSEPVSYTHLRAHETDSLSRMPSSA